jgi:hypothetical protein
VPAPPPAAPTDGPSTAPALGTSRPDAVSGPVPRPRTPAPHPPNPAPAAPPSSSWAADPPTPPSGAPLTSLFAASPPKPATQPPATGAPHLPPRPEARPRIVQDPVILGLTRVSRSRLGSRLFTWFFVFVYLVIVIQLIWSILQG